MASSLRQAFAGLAQQLVVGHLADERLLELARADRRRAHAADRHRGARDFAGRVLDQQRRRRHDGEIAVAAGKLDEGIAVAFRPDRKAHARSAISSGSIAGVM